MKNLVNFINEKLLINKDIKTVFSMYEPESLDEKDINFAWGDIFDNIHLLKSGNIQLGKILLPSKKDHPKYENSIFTLYPNYKGKITLRRSYDSGCSIWCTADNLKELVSKMTKLLIKEKYEIEQQ